jgi:hypothetical protein
MKTHAHDDQNMYARDLGGFDMLLIRALRTIRPCRKPVCILAGRCSGLDQLGGWKLIPVCGQMLLLCLEVFGGSSE